MEKYPELLEILESGYATELTQTLLDSIQCYARALAADNVCMGERDSENLYNLTWLLKALLKDCHNIDVQ